MKLFIIGALALITAAAIAPFALAAPPQETGGLRCGSDLVEIGDHAYLVFQKCGQPLERQLLGFAMGGSQGSDLTVEEWIYGPRAGYYYFVTFVGGRVTEILSERD